MTERELAGWELGLVSGHATQLLPGVPNLIATIRELKALLREVEWMEYEEGIENEKPDERFRFSCPFCGAFKHYGHGYACRLAAAIKED